LSVACLSSLRRVADFPPRLSPERRPFPLHMALSGTWADLDMADYARKYLRFAGNVDGLLAPNCLPLATKVISRPPLVWA